MAIELAPWQDSAMRASLLLPLVLLACSSSSTPTTTDTGTDAADDTGEMDMGTDTGVVDVGGETAPGEHVVTVSNFKYAPATITIKAGETVTWKFTQGTHTVTSGTSCTKAAGFDSGLHDAPYTFTHTFPTAGTFDYFCDYMTHCTSRGQVGQVIVTP